MSIFDTFGAALLAARTWRRGEREPVILADNNVILLSDLFRLCLDVDDVLPHPLAGEVRDLQRHMRTQDRLRAGASFGEASLAMLRLVELRQNEA